jgi:hypothetical protein
MDHAIKELKRIMLSIKDDIEELKNNQQSNTELLTASDVCQMMQISYVYFMTRHKKQMPYLKKGKRLYYKREDVMKYMETQDYVPYVPSKPTTV